MCLTAGVGARPGAFGARLLRIAAGVVQGQSLAAIAREEGVSRQTIAKQAKSDDVRQILVAMVNNQLD